MTKVLLTNSPAPPHGQSPFFCLEKRPPLGLGFIASTLEKNGVEVDFVDNYVEPIDIRKYILETKPDYVGISVNTICFQEFLKMFDSIKDLDVKFVCGGPHVSVMPESIPQEVDYIVIGEGEKAMLDIVNGKTNSKFVCPEPIKNLDELPGPKWEMFEGIKYWDWMEFLDGRPVFSLNTSRGCPFGCNFCSVSSIWGRTYRYLSADKIIEEIKYLINKYSCHSFYCREDNFTFNKQRVIDFCEKAKPLGIEFVCESRIDNLNRELLEKLKDSGLKGLYLGTESGSDRVLKLMNKNITVAMIREKVNLIKEVGIKIMASWVIHCPGETQEEAEQTFLLAKELNCEINNMNIFAGIPTSKFYNDLLVTKEYEKIDNCFIIRPKGYDEWAKRVYGWCPP
jgi:radical SAM superfamily enzyme YgiQ (UPF0313 family)